MSLRHTFLYRKSKLDPQPPQAAANHNAVCWDLLTPRQIESLREIGPFDVADGLRRFERGDLCYTASVGGRLAHYSWVQRSGAHPITDAGIELPANDTDFWIYNCRTAEWTRGQGIYPATLMRILREQFAEGRTNGWIYTSRENIASQRGITRAGFHQVATLKSLRVGGRFYRLGAQWDRELAPGGQATASAIR